MKRLQWLCLVSVFLLPWSLTAANRGGYSSLTEPQRRTASQNQNSYRLPANVIPQRYKVKLVPHFYEGLEENFWFEGDVKIFVKCLRRTNVIVLHTDGLNVSESFISVIELTDGVRRMYSRQSYDAERHFLSLHLNKPMDAGTRYMIDIVRFTGRLRNDGEGLYYSYYMDGNDKVYFLASELMAVFARRVFPCFDEPQLKAQFDITLVRRNDTRRRYVSLSNAAFDRHSDSLEGDGWLEDHFESTPNMSTYLLAFLICDFPNLLSYSSTVPPVKFRTFAPHADLPAARKMHETSLRVFQEISRRFRLKYSQALTKLDSVWLPHFNFEATENWGLITYDLNLLRAMGSPRADLQVYCLVTHEILHQWFGNCVTPKWWKWAWLSEGLARWLDVYFTQQTHPGWNVTQYRLATDVDLAMRIDSDAATSHPIETLPVRPDQIYSNFDDLAYYKATALVRMMHLMMGTSTFFTSLNTYLTRHQYSNVTSSDLFTVLDQTLQTKGCQERVMSSRMPAWFSQPGMPVVTVTKIASGHRLTQTSVLPGPENYQWDIPIAYATDGGLQFNTCRDNFWLRKNQKLNLPTAHRPWVLVNANQMAYCRVLYDSHSYNALINQLNTDHTVISAVSRGMVINDALTFSESNQLSLSVALRTVDYLKSELELSPWLHFYHWFQKRAGLLETSALKNKLKLRIMNLVREPVRQLDLTITDTMAPTDVLVREILAQLACRYGLSACVERAKQVFQDWNKTRLLRPYPALASLYLCTAVAEGTYQDWAHVLSQYDRGDNSEDDRAIILQALGCSTNHTVLKMFLALCLLGGQGIPSSRTPQCVSAVANNTAGRPVALRFMMKMFRQLKRSHAAAIPFMLRAVTADLYSERFLNNQSQTLRKRYKLPAVMREVERKVRANRAWMTKHHNTLKTWLN